MTKGEYMQAYIDQAYIDLFAKYSHSDQAASSPEFYAEKAHLDSLREQVYRWQRSTEVAQLSSMLGGN